MEQNNPAYFNEESYWTERADYWRQQIVIGKKAVEVAESQHMIALDNLRKTLGVPTEGSEAEWLGNGEVA